MNIRQAAKELGIAASTLHRWLKDGFIVGEQLTPGAPWQIRVNDALRRRLVQAAPEGYLVMQEATKLLGVTRQTVLQRVKRGELEAVLLHEGRRKGLRIKVSNDNPGLFERTS
jgi:excisionase family DNA binding protein